MVKIEILKSRQAWLDKRSRTIGGSDAAAIIGLSPWKTNVDLWREKVQDKPKDEDNQNQNEIYGTLAEKHLREMFKLDYPGYKVGYEENNLFKNDKYPWAHASLDGWLEHDNQRGVLEIKTANIMSGAQALKWAGKIPEYYYVQVLHEMAVYDADFAYIKALLRKLKDREIYQEVKHYRIDRADVSEEIAYLMNSEQLFWEYVQEKRKPGLILPEIA